MMVGGIIFPLLFSPGTQPREEEGEFLQISFFQIRLLLDFLAVQFVAHSCFPGNINRKEHFFQKVLVNCSESHNLHNNFINLSKILFDTL